MPDELQYKDFVGSIRFNATEEVFFGRIEGVDDLVSFEGKTVPELKAAFEEAVDDYLDLCQRAGKTIEHEVSQA